MCADQSDNTVLDKCMTEMYSMIEGMAKTYYSLDVVYSAFDTFLTSFETNYVAEFKELTPTYSKDKSDSQVLAYAKEKQCYKLKDYPKLNQTITWYWRNATIYYNHPFVYLIVFEACQTSLGFNSTTYEAKLKDIDYCMNSTIFFKTFDDDFLGQYNLNQTKDLQPKIMDMVAL